MTKRSNMSTVQQTEAPVNGIQNPQPTTEAATDTLAHALACLRTGLSVIPIRRDGTKAPAATSWKPYQERLATEDEVRPWFDCASPPGNAVVCGWVSGNAEMIDFDASAKEIFPAWVFLVASESPGLVDRLTQIETPRDASARHVWYRWAEVEIPGNSKLAQDHAKLRQAADLDKQAKTAEDANEPEAAFEYRQKAKRLRSEATFIETRGEGGYASLPAARPAATRPAAPIATLPERR